MYYEHPRTFSILCGAPDIAQAITTRLESLGFCFNPTSSVTIIRDAPQGFALPTLEVLDRTNLYLIVVSYNLCAEYWEDLWDLGIHVLLVDGGIDHELPDAIVRAVQGERYRVTPKGTTPLILSERQVLRYVARGWSNKRIAGFLHLQEKTVMNVLTSVYSKLDLKSRTEAVLYYWGIWHLFNDSSF